MSARFRIRPVPVREQVARWRAAVRARCTCSPGPRDLAEPHDPECSLWNTGWLG